MRNELALAVPMRQVKGFTGNRYSEDQKLRVTRFVQEYDEKHGRGGIAAAQRQFQVSYIALRNWLTGKLDPKNTNAKNKDPKIKEPKNKRGGRFSPAIARLLSIKGQVSDLERELRRLHPRM